eukprot:TRINITY_DN8596_c0_g1_i1.p1 TRINITY_DN8596_c0_g1~~TRINITY_DN8596_c0_g1_i1.p1  ORF type:complete len:263 (-),score=24.83 TRINITY_DN8596_c0_g1_i1:20-808(-)
MDITDLFNRLDYFTWTMDESPLSDVYSVGAVCIAYLVVIYFIQFLQRTMKWKFELRLLQAVHNFVLFVFSLGLFSLTVYEMFYQLSQGYTMFDLYCDPENQFNKGRLFLYVWLFHLSKIYEFIDTLFLVLKGSNLRFLHVYHHVLTYISTWVGMCTMITFQWMGVGTNTLVHTFMYYYYFKKSLWPSMIIPWRDTLTQFQMSQFIFNLSVLFLWAPTNMKYNCSGSWLSWGLTVIANVTFFILFLRMYLSSRKQNKTKQKNQ